MFTKPVQVKIINALKVLGYLCSVQKRIFVDLYFLQTLPSLTRLNDYYEFNNKTRGKVCAMNTQTIVFIGMCQFLMPLFYLTCFVFFILPITYYRVSVHCFWINYNGLCFILSFMQVPFHHKKLELITRKVQNRHLVHNTGVLSWADAQYCSQIHKSEEEQGKLVNK